MSTIFKRTFLFVGVWVCSQLALYRIFGIRLGGDSGRYLIGAENILQGIRLTQEQFHYLAYEWMLVPIFALSDEKGIVKNT